MEAPKAAEAVALEKALGSLTLPTDMIICIDGSGSVTKENFELEKLCAKMVANLQNYADLPGAPGVPATRIGFLQFTNQAFVGSALTARFDEFAGRLAAMPQQGGGTSARAVLEAALAVFRTDERAASRAVVLITDGDVADAVGVGPLAQGLAQAHVRLIVCGIGLSEAGRQSVLGLHPDCFVFFQHFAALQACMQQVCMRPSAPPQLTVRSIGSSKIAFDVIYGAEFRQVDLEAREAEASHWTKAGASSVFTVRADQLRPGTSYRFRCRVQLKGAAEVWSPYSTELVYSTLKLRPESLILKDPKRLAAEHDRLRRAVLDLKFDHLLRDADISTFNVLLMGRMANGKSSYLNTIASTLTGQWQGLALAGERPGGGTYTLSISKKHASESLRIWDTFGWDGTNWPDSEVDLLVSGRLREGYEFGKKVDDYLVERPSVADKVHAVIIVCDLPSATSEKQMQELDKFYHLLTHQRRNLQPIIVLTKPDVIGSGDAPEEMISAERLDSVYDNGVLDAAIGTFCRNTKIAREFTFPVLNYRGLVAQPNLAQEFLALAPMKAALDQAALFVRAELQRTVRLMDAATNQRLGEQDLLLRDGEIDMPVGVLRDATRKWGALAGLPGYSFRTRAGRTVPADEEKELIKINQCRTKILPEDRYVVFLAHSSAAAAAPALTASASLPVAPSASASAAPALKVSLRWRSPGSESLGFVNVPGDASVAALRAQIAADEVEVEQADYVFATADGKGPLPRPAELATRVASLLLPDGVVVLLPAPPPSSSASPSVGAAAKLPKISVVLVKGPASAPTSSESIGFFDDLSGEATLEAVRRKLADDEVEDVPADFRFLDNEPRQPNPVSLPKEKSMKLEACLRRCADGLSFWIRAKDK